MEWWRRRKKERNENGFESNKAIIAGPWTAIEPISVVVYVRGVDVRVAETVEISSPETKKNKTKKENDAIIWYFVCGTTHDYLRHRRRPVSSPG